MAEFESAVREDGSYLADPDVLVSRENDHSPDVRIDFNYLSYDQSMDIDEALTATLKLKFRYPYEARLFFSLFDRAEKDIA